MPEPDTTPAASLCHCGLGTREGCATEPWGCGPASTDPGTTGRTETGVTIPEPQAQGEGAGDNDDTHRRLLAVSRTAREEKRRRHDTEEILRDLIDPDPCWYDHHGYCQAHSWMATEPACPHARAKTLLTPPAPGGHDGEGQ